MMCSGFKCGKFKCCIYVDISNLKYLGTARATLKVGEGGRVWLVTQSGGGGGLKTLFLSNSLQF